MYIYIGYIPPKLLYAPRVLMCTEDSRAPLKKVPLYLRPPTESFQRKLSIEPTFEARRQLRYIYIVKKLPTKTKLNET